MIGGVAQTVVGQALALGRAPLALVRGSGGEEKVLKNAKDSCAAEALEIATYLAIERLAKDVDDEQTAKLAASIRADEEQMLERLQRELPKLTDAVVRAEIDGDPSYDLGTIGAVDAVRETAEDVKETARGVGDSAKRATRQARKVPGVAQAEGEIKGALASEEDLPISGYDDLTAEEIVAKLPALSQIDLAKVDAYERKHDNRTTVLDKIASLRGDEPWPGYDELTVAEIDVVLREADAERRREGPLVRARAQEPHGRHARDRAPARRHVVGPHPPVAPGRVASPAGLLHSVRRRSSRRLRAVASALHAAPAITSASGGAAAAEAGRDEAAGAQRRRDARRVQDARVGRAAPSRTRPRARSRGRAPSRASSPAAGAAPEPAAAHRAAQRRRRERPVGEPLEVAPEPRRLAARGRGARRARRWRTPARTSTAPASSAAAGTSQTRASVQASAGPRLRGRPSSVSTMPMCQSSMSQVSAHHAANAPARRRNGSRPASASAAHAAAPIAIQRRIRRAVAGRARRSAFVRRWLAARKRATARGAKRASSSSASCSRAHSSPAVEPGPAGGAAPGSPHPLRPSAVRGA